MERVSYQSGFFFSYLRNVQVGKCCIHYVLIILSIQVCASVSMSCRKISASNLMCILLAAFGGSILNASH